MKQEKTNVLIIIDGSNFYFKLKDLGYNNLLSFDFSSFSKFLSNGYRLVQSTYYVGKIRTDGSKKTQELFNNQRKLISHLKKHNYKYVFGYLLKTNGIFHEKGVDIQMATDMLIAAYEKHCSKIYLVSSDTDLLPAIEKVMNKGIHVVYIGFSHKPSKVMLVRCTSSRLLTKNDLSVLSRKK